jgi:hypothetical protein
MNAKPSPAVNDAAKLPYERIVEAMDLAPPA